jgi:hypothetical protein
LKSGADVDAFLYKSVPMQASPVYPHQPSPVVAFGYKNIGPYYWVGHCDNGIDYYAGQTFKAPANGKLRCIRLFASMVYGNTDATLSVFEFDRYHHSWKQKRAEARQHVTKAMEGQWINFEIPGVVVNKDDAYAFKLSCNSGGMLAIAECPWTIMNPYADGEEWIGSSQRVQGNFHKDFGLAFEAEIYA